MLQRILLWERRNNTVEPFGETVQQVYARVSALRDRLDGTVVSILCNALSSAPLLHGSYCSRRCLQCTSVPLLLWKGSVP